MNFSIISDELVSDGKGGFLGSVSTITSAHSLEEFGAIACQFHITPAIFRDNIRKKDCLQSIEFLCYDFDSGVKSQDIADILTQRNYPFIILASKNHLRDKGDGKGIIERFHVFIPVSEVITIPSLYKSVISSFARFVKMTGFDTQCTDSTRYFYKHREILYNIEVGVKPGTGTGTLFYTTWLNEQKKERDDHERAVKQQLLDAETYGQDELLEKFKRSKCFNSAKTTLSVDGERRKRLYGLVRYGREKCGLSEMTLRNLLLPLCVFNPNGSFTRAYFDKTVSLTTFK